MCSLSFKCLSHASIGCEFYLSRDAMIYLLNHVVNVDDLTFVACNAVQRVLCKLVVGVVAWFTFVPLAFRVATDAYARRHSKIIARNTLAAIV